MSLNQTSSTFEVTIKPSNLSFVCESGETILEAALKAGFKLPYGCKDGVCGSCKGTLLDGTVNHKTYQDGVLSQTELDHNRILYCCAIPDSNISIEVKSIGANKDIEVKTMPSRIESLEKVTDTVIVMKLKLPSHEQLKFLAGQYIDILWKDGRRRSFSLANNPADNKIVELHLRYRANPDVDTANSFTYAVFNTMKVKDILRFEGPLGQFFLREDSDKPMIFLATGTGFAPIKSIFEDIVTKGIKRPIHFYWGANNLDEMYLKSMAEQWAVDHADFLKFIPVLSSPEDKDEWQGRTGLVHEAVLADFEDLSNYEVYACGAPVMIESAVKAFVEQRNLPITQFFSDAFTLPTF